MTIKPPPGDTFFDGQSGHTFFELLSDPSSDHEKQELSKILSRAVKIIQIADMGDYSITKPDAVKRFENVLAALRLLLKEFDGGSGLLPIILDDPEDFLKNEIEMISGMIDLQSRIKDKLDSLPLKRGKSLDKPRLTNKPKPKQLCALIMGIIWEKTHGSEFRQSTPANLHLCDKLWRRASREVISSSFGNAPSGWIGHIRESKKYKMSGIEKKLINELFIEKFST